MFSLSNAPISRKILVITMLITAVTLVVIISASSVREYFKTKSAKIEQFASITSVLANATNATLVFGADEEARQFLEALEEEPEVEAAVLYSHGDVFAFYAREEGYEPPSLPTFEGSRWTGATLEYVIPVFSDNQRDQLGAMLVIAEVDVLRTSIWNGIRAGIILFAIGLILAAILSSRLQRHITTPLSNLADMAHEVSNKQDYSVRGQKLNEDEVGSLVDSFNFMLETIEVSNEKLKEHRDTLQFKVAEKTRDLKLAMEAAQKASRAKSDFLATMSHELRTPMNAIMGMATILDDEVSLVQRQECITTIQGSSEKLLELINNILDFTKMESGDLDLDRDKIDLKDFVCAVVEKCASQFKHKDVVFRTEFSSLLKKHFYGDAKRVSQVLLSLVQNAGKFTPFGDVKVVVELKDNTKDTLRFRIIDTGIGISEEEQTRLFKLFSQVDSSVTRRYGGTGLGLAISNKIVDAMNGDISVVSEKGKGSEFVVEIPYDYDEKDVGVFEVHTPAEKSPVSADSQDVIDYSSLKVLLVEDTVMNQKVFVRMMMKEIGCDVVIAQNGLEGFEQALRQSYDIIFMDLHMPVMDGIQSAKKIRELGDTIQQPRIVALTADVQIGIEKEVLDAGMDFYLAKPLRKGVLTSTMDEMMSELSA